MIMERLNLMALRMGYMQIFGFICLLFIFLSLIVIGRYKWLMRKFGKEYYPALKYQKKKLETSYNEEFPNIYIRSSHLYEHNVNLFTEFPISSPKQRFIRDLSKKHNVILLAPDIDDDNVDRSLYKYIQYINYYHIPICRITNIIPDNIKLKEIEYVDHNIRTTFTYFIKEEKK